eukprot:10055551-Heterocapsa_arctica.AAC.1
MIPEAEAYAPKHRSKPVHRPPGLEGVLSLEMDVDECSLAVPACPALASLGHQAQFFRLVQGAKRHKHLPVAPASGSQPAPS